MHDIVKRKTFSRRGLSLLLALCLLVTMCARVSAASKGEGESVGQLKILARFNDSMDFYDGHVYLMFTSYKDGVEIRIDDLYKGYEISDQYYYQDIREDIANGSNHTGSDVDKYFTLRDDMKSVTLSRGEVVSIGMYRAFELSVEEAAFFCIWNSTLARKVVGKQAAMKFVKALWDYLFHGRKTGEEDILAFLHDIEKEGVDIGKLLDGTASGGVCLNRELYNQKLMYDQYENVSFALDINQAQLERLMQSLSGNRNRYSILKNSCATVTLKGWNAAVGVDENGEKTEYYLEPSGEGIFAYIDAPKTVKDEIRRLPGSWLNNSMEVQEPGAGYQDDTGWVYVSAPKRLDADTSR